MTAALNNGWQLYGQPTLAYDQAKGHVVCGQAITKEAPGDYKPGIKLSEQ